MAKKKKEMKMPRSEHYEPKLKITGSFEDVIKVSITPTPEKKEEEKPVQKKK